MLILGLACAGPEPSPERLTEPARPEAPTQDDPRLAVVNPPEPLLNPEPVRMQHAPLCDEPNACALLVHYTLQQLEAGDACAICGERKPELCERDWPFSDLPLCSEWHELERCIWLTTGARKLPDLDVPARQNVIELQRRLDDEIACLPD
jgi:hypothetical protein